MVTCDNIPPKIVGAAIFTPDRWPQILKICLKLSGLQFSHPTDCLMLPFNAVYRNGVPRTRVWWDFVFQEEIKVPLASFSRVSCAFLRRIFCKFEKLHRRTPRNFGSKFARGAAKRAPNSRATGRRSLRKFYPIVQLAREFSARLVRIFQ